jgi:hypothetical protein
MRAPRAKAKETGEKEKKKFENNDPYSKKIDELFDFKAQMFKKRDKLRIEFDKQMDAFYDQDDLIRRIEYMVKQKEHIKKIETIKEAKAKELEGNCSTSTWPKTLLRSQLKSIYGDDIGM